MLSLTNDFVQIIDFKPEYAGDFKSLNYEWLERYFSVEPIDEKVLGDPKKHIIDSGGNIVFALHRGTIVGTCALKKVAATSYEMTKMAVTPKAQGLQIGKKLAQAIIEIARRKKADYIFLESNRKLVPALNLYRRLGFVEKAAPFSTSDYQRSDIYMELRL